MRAATVAVLLCVLGLRLKGLHPAAAIAHDPPENSRDKDRHDILAAYKEQRDAHFNQNAAAFLSHYDTEWRMVAGGAVSRRKKAAERPRIQAYFDSVKFSEITDLDPPQIQISSDGSMAWLLGHVRVRGTQHPANGPETPLTFEAAWIDLWQKKNGEWRIVARANTEANASVKN